MIDQSLLPDSTDPTINLVVSAASQSPNESLAPGGWVTIFGDNLASGDTIASGTNLPTALGGLEVWIGGQPLTLYYTGKKQVNGLLPWTLQPGAQYTIAEEHPAIFTQNQAETGQAAALLAGTATLAGSSNPVSRGGVVELSGTGLGPIDHTVADGTPASTTELPRANVTVTATVGGVPAEVQFAGLTPGSIGLFQTNVKVPINAPVGDAVEIVIYQKGVPSNVTTIAVR